MTRAARHVLSYDGNITSRTRFAYCSCGWSAGPGGTLDLYRDHNAHVDQVRGLKRERHTWPDDNDPLD